jgi:glycosyltransferase involved in cell wall biosynthesis
MPLITTIIPTYRRPKMLRRAIESVLSQTHPDFQVCVYDNASGDETRQVVQEFAKADSRVKYHCHSENIGAVKNFAFGMRQVQTSFFSLLADDDLLLPDFYETTLEGFRKHPNAMFSTTKYLYIDGKGRLRGIGLSGWKDDVYYPPEGYVKEINSCMLSILSTLYRREVLDLFGVFDERMVYFADEYIPRITVTAPFVVSTKPGYINVIHDSSTSLGGNVKAPALLSDYTLFMEKAQQWALSLDLPESVNRDIMATLSVGREMAIYSVGLRAIFQRDLQNARDSIAILHGCLASGKEYQLRLLLRLFKLFPWISDVMDPFLEARRCLKSQRNWRVLHGNSAVKKIADRIRAA